jgi:hypothetical protein
MATCNTKQSEAIQAYLKGIKDKAYIVIFDILDEQESTAFIQVHYNDQTRVAMDFKQWDIREIHASDAMVEMDILGVKVREFVHAILDQLIYELGENEVVVRRVMVEEDGSME